MNVPINPQSVLGILNDHSFVKTRVDTHMHLFVSFLVVINDRAQFIVTIKYAALNIIQTEKLIMNYLTNNLLLLILLLLLKVL